MRTNSFGIAVANMAPPPTRSVTIAEEAPPARERTWLSRSNLLCAALTFVLVGTGIGITTYYVLVEM
jgi:hypothetical protein